MIALPRPTMPIPSTVRPDRRARRALVAALLVSSVVLGPAGTTVMAADPSPGSSIPVASPSAGAFDPRVARRIEEVMAQVPELRGIEPAGAVPYRAISEEEFRAELERLYREESPPELVAAEDAAFTRLGLLAPDDDLEALTLALYESQVLAYYDPRTDTFSVVGGIDDFGPETGIVIAHEYTHALQDQRWDLEGTRMVDPSRADTILAHAALAEGDATAVMFDWATDNLSLGELLKVSLDSLSGGDRRLLRRTPQILRRQLESPYLDGLTFVSALRARDGWAAVDAAWEARPVSTEQVLHPERYPDDVPVAVEIPDVAGLLGEGWSAAYHQTLGEMLMGVWVADGERAREALPGLPGPLPRAEAVDGWDGDRLVSLDGPDGAWAVVWQTAWDSDRDAREFREAAVGAMKDLDGSNAVLRSDIVGGLPSPVLVLIADGEETLDALRTALDLEA